MNMMLSVFVMGLAVMLAICIWGLSRKDKPRSTKVSLALSSIILAVYLVLALAGHWSID